MNLTEQPLQSANPHHGTDSTGANGVRGRCPSLSLILVSGALSITGTSSAEPFRVWDAHCYEAEATSSAPGWQLRYAALNNPDTSRHAICKLRRISGLTWDQLATMFQVSRRSVHFWASGKPLNSKNERRLAQVLEVVETADRGTPRATRLALLETRGEVSALSLLTEERYGEARELLGEGTPHQKPALTQLSATAKAARKPLPPEELVDARNERVHRDHGQARATHTVRTKPRGNR